MENFNVWRLAARQWRILVVVTLVVFAISLAVYRSKPQSLSVSQSFTVVPLRTYPQSGPLVIQNDPTRDTQLLVSNVSSLFSDPGYAQGVLNRANASGGRGLRELSKRFKVVQGAAQSGSFQVQYSAVNNDEAARLTAAVQSQTAAALDQYNAREGIGLKGALQEGAPVISSQADSLPLTPIAGLLAGLILASVVAALADRAK